MIRVHKEDPFFSKQPERGFIELLKAPIHTVKPKDYGTRLPESGETDFSGLYLQKDFPDAEGLLDTAYADFQLFLSVYEIGGNTHPLAVRYAETAVFEAYRIEITAVGITLSAGDTEGIRRGLVAIEDLFRSAEAPYLKAQTVEAKPHIKDRIFRGFFSPTNRAPKFGDELLDDMDYYPENYLNRLAHDAINGLWIYTSFRALLPPSLIAEYGDNWEKRIAKLNRVIQKCRRYGIKVYVFAIEPLGDNDPEIARKYPDTVGATVYEGKHCFCTGRDFGKAYCRISTENLCKLCPGLGGYISITQGERPTNCANTEVMDCPICGRKTRGTVLAEACQALKSGMRKTDTDFISWTYGHRRWPMSDIEDYIAHLPTDVIAMQNFDDMGVAEQLGKARLGVDYWLSYAGPSDLFRKTAEFARQYGKTLYAKMQISNSHEVATVPYIPTPGIIFEKMKGARECGVSGIMGSWYFGNYPSVMTKALGLLSFTEDFSDKRAFLEQLSAIYYGKKNAARAASAFAAFEEGYKNYPLNIMFSYYGPMHDGITWDLQLEPKNFSLPRSWYSTDMPDGDRIGDCLFDGHTLQEAATLCERICAEWRKGMAILDTIPNDGTADYAEQHTNAAALGVLFESGTDILNFYRLREMLGKGQGNASELLDEMEALVHSEMALCDKMIPLCTADTRLGYHSEAENYKFFPEKIACRKEHLQALLATEFFTVRKRIEAGTHPLPYYLGEEAGIPHLPIAAAGQENAVWQDLLDGTTRFRAWYDAETLYFEWQSTEEKTLCIAPEYELMASAPTVRVSPEGKIDTLRWDCDVLYRMMALHYPNLSYWKRYRATVLPDAPTHIVLSVARSDIGWTKDTPFKVKIMDSKQSLWVTEENPIATLGKFDASPNEYGWLIPQKA